MIFLQAAELKSLPKSDNATGKMISKLVKTCSFILSFKINFSKKGKNSASHR